MNSVYSTQFSKVWYKLSKEIESKMEEMLAPTLTAGQLRVLELITANERMKPSNFLEYLDTSAAAVTTLLDRMEKNEFIVRQKDEFDRRIVWVNMTDKGIMECERGVKIREELLKSYLNRISAHNQQLLIFLLGKIAN